jgi:ADP-heptose:LPS heptosyltransferase
LKKQHGCELHYLTKKHFSSVLAGNPYIDKLHIFEEDLEPLIAELKKENFDFIVDLHNSLRSRLVKLRLGKKSSTFKKLNLKKWLLVHLKINLLPEIHIVDRYFGTVKELGVVNDGIGLDYFIPEQDEVHKENLPETQRHGFIAFVIGAKHFTKQIPAEIAVKIGQNTSKPVVLLGDKNDREKGDLIIKDVGAHVFNACGNYNINQSASIIKQAEKVVTADTGLMHIAAAFNKKIISLWGNTVPAFGMAPYMPENPAGSIIIENNKLRCRPCSKLGFTACPKKHFNCMKQLNTEEIVNKLNDD